MPVGALVLVILGVAFGLGVLVGRHRTWPTHRAMAADSARKPAPTSRRGGLTEANAERPPQLQEKLTFYQTLRAPLEPVGISDPGGATAKPANAPVNRAKTLERASEGTSSRATEHDGQATPALATAQSRSTSERNEMRASSLPREGERQEAMAQWTVQVGVFSSLQQAAGVKRRLAEGGFEAQVVPTTGSDGQARYRVRLGAFKSKEEADRTAERVRSGRSLPTFVTAR